MPAGGVRWKDVREFLDDMPLQHCTVKPPHELCTICLRINYGVANDCPLFSKPYVGGATEPDTAKRTATAPPHEPVVDHLSREDVSHALRGDDFPLIEFAGPRKSPPKGKARPRAAPPPARLEDEEPLDVAPLEVVPMEAPPPGPSATAGPGADPSMPAAAAGTATAAPAAGEAGGDVGAAPVQQEGQARAKVDPEELMHRIMEELEIPEDEEEAPEPGDAGEAGATSVPREERRDDGGRVAGGASEGGRPLVVEKRIVLRKRKKGED